jgi:hypothetical protein
MEKISWTEGRRRGISLHTTKRRKAYSIIHVLLRNFLIKHIIEGTIEGGIEVTGRQGRRRKQLWMTSREREDTGN